MAERRLDDIGAEASSLVAKIGGTLELEPLQEFMRNKLAGEAAAPMRSLRAMGEGGSRTQSDLHALGKVESDRCQACFEDEGTFLHRCVGCGARAE